MSSKNITIKISKDFTVYPGARYLTDGPFSGQKFYEDILKGKFGIVWDKKDSKIVIDFDDTYGYASSFISEIFLRLVKDYKDKKKIKEKLIIKTEDDPLLKDLIYKEIEAANSE